MPADVYQPTSQRRLCARSVVDPTTRFFSVGEQTHEVNLNIGFVSGLNDSEDLLFVPWWLQIIDSNRKWGLERCAPVAALPTEGAVNTAASLV